MKIKQLLTKTLLVAVALLGGASSAWAVDYPYSVGTSTSDGWYTAISPVYSLSGNGIIDITFTNYCVAGGNAWENWSLICGKSTDTPAASTENTNRHFVMRADYYDDIAGSNTAFTTSDGYGTDINTFQNEATVKLRICRVGTKVTVYTTVSKNSTTKTMSFPFSGVGENETLKFYLTQRLSYLTITEEPTITETITSQDYQDGVADWTSGNTSRYLVGLDSDGANKYLKAYVNPDATGSNANGGNGAVIMGSTLNGKVTAGTDFASSSDFTLFFDLKLTGGGNQTSWFHLNDASNNNGGDEAVGTHMLTLHQKAAGGTEWEINGATDQTVTLAKNTWYTFKLSKSANFLYLTVINTNTGAEVLAQAKITVNSTVGGLGNMKFATKRYNAFMGIDNVILRNLLSGDVPAGTATSYTIKYRNESAVEIANDIVVDGLVDDEVTASAAQMNPITYNTQKYIYKSGNKNIILVADAASNVITLVYREAETYTYKLTSSCLGTVFANSSDFEGNTVYVPYPKYELKDNILYQAVGGNSGDYFRDKYTLSADVDETKTYNKTAIRNVVFYIEGENITGASINNNERSADTRNSNGATGYAAGTAGEDDLTITTLPAGKYKIVANLHTSTSAGGTSTFKLGENTFAAVGNVSSQNTEKTSDEFTITGNTDLVLQAGGGKTNSVDYVYVIRTDVDYITVSSAGMATYVNSDYDLDFSASEIKAYKVKVTSKGVATMTQVNNVPKDTPVLLVKDGGATEAIPVMTGAAAVSDNDLVKGTGAAVPTYETVNTDNDYTNMVLNNKNSKLGFYFANGLTVGTNRAYLHFESTLAPETNAPMMLVFDGETTGISTMHNSQCIMHNEIYDLQGRKVVKPAKGLYIVNGKKVVIK